MPSLLIRGGTVLTLNDAWDVIDGDVSIRDGRIAAIGPDLSGPHDRVVEARGGYILPGLIQTHVHLCQTLFRGYADDLALIRSMNALSPAHGPALFQMNTGTILAGAPSVGSWVTYGLGTENENLPGYIVFTDNRGGPINGAPN